MDPKSRLKNDNEKFDAKYEFKMAQVILELARKNDKALQKIFQKEVEDPSQSDQNFCLRKDDD